MAGRPLVLEFTFVRGEKAYINKGFIAFIQSYIVCTASAVAVFKNLISFCVCCLFLLLSIPLRDFVYIYICIQNIINSASRA